jgi:hypothetical protein
VPGPRAASRPRRGPTASSHAMCAADGRTGHAELRGTLTAPRAPVACQPRRGRARTPAREGRGPRAPSAMDARWTGAPGGPPGHRTLCRGATAALAELRPRTRGTPAEL